MTIKDLQPKAVWENFYGLTRIPRPSKHEAKVQEYLLEWGKKNGVDVKRDDTGNIIFSAPATKGFEDRKGIIMQAHMDMVPQKTADTKHDFLKDPIETEIKGEWVGAKGTTLGADNGIGVAIALSVLQDKTLKHGPLEALITYDEETGMTGANALKPGVLKGDILLNLDSEEEGELCTGCAGGIDGIADFAYRTYKTPDGFTGYKVTVKGMKGGHSGMDIALCRANANKVLCRILIALINEYGIKVASITGGSLRNAIPFEAEACILVPAAETRKVKSLAEKIFEEIKFEYQYSDPDMLMLYDKSPKPAARYIGPKTVLAAVKAILACPHGVKRMSDTLPGLPETSTNMAMIRTEKGHLKVYSLTRSSIDSAKMSYADSIRYVFELAGAKYSTSGAYSGWAPKLGTPMIKVLEDTYKKLFNKDLKITATHGGLECAIMGAKYPNWEMVSIGPTIVHPHSPDERVEIASVEKAWKFVTALLENVPKK